MYYPRQREQQRRIVWVVQVPQHVVSEAESVQTTDPQKLSGEEET